jgi:CHASE1-domain containing sensor protein
MDGFWASVLGWNELGPVAILFVMLLATLAMIRYLLIKVLADKDSQIARANALVDKATDETGKTLAQILEAIRENSARQRGGKS